MFDRIIGKYFGHDGYHRVDGKAVCNGTIA